MSLSLLLVLYSCETAEEIKKKAIKAQETLWYGRTDSYRVLLHKSRQLIFGDIKNKN